MQVTRHQMGLIVTSLPQDVLASLGEDEVYTALTETDTNNWPKELLEKYLPNREIPGRS